MKIASFVFNPFQENTYVLYDETRECIIVDPGCYEADENKTLDSFIQQHRLQVRMVLNTHCHIDHVLGNYHVKEKYGVKLYIHPIEEPYLRAVSTYAGNYGLEKYTPATPDAFIEEDDILSFGAQRLRVIFTPGHSPGHVSFYNERTKALMAGDVLFYNSIGRTDLPGGDHETLITSIHQKLFTLPDDTVVYPGHGNETKIGFEKKHNPFCALTFNP